MRRYALKNVMSILMLILMNIAGCSGDNSSSGPQQQQSPMVITAISPSNETLEVNRNCPIIITFSDAIDASSIDIAMVSISSANGNIVQINNISTDGNNLTVEPKYSLDPSTKYTVKVSKNIKSLAGTTLDKDVLSEFTTKAQSWSPLTAFGQSGWPTVASNNRGDSVVVWQNYNYTTRAYEINFMHCNKGNWSVPTTIDNVNSPSNPQAAIDNNGDAIIVWQYWSPWGGIGFIEYNNGAWSSVVRHDMSGDSISPASVAMNNNGKASIVWEQYRKIYKIERSAGNWSQPERLTDYDTYDPVVKISDSGNTFVLWNYNNHYAGQSKIISIEYRNGNWSQPSCVSVSGNDIVSGYRAAVNSNGNAIVVWQQRMDYRVYKNEYKNGVWGGATAISDQGRQTVQLPSVAMSNDYIIVAWQQFDVNVYQAYVCESYRGIWTGARPKSVPQVSSTFPVVTMNESGNAILIWNQLNGQKWQGCIRERKNGSWGDQIILTESNNYLNPVQYRPTISENGDILIAWQQSDGANWQMYRCQYF